MAIPMIQVYNKVTGKKTFLPASALPNFPGYARTPSQRSRDQVPDGSAFPTEPADDVDELADGQAQEPPRSGAGSGTDVWRAYAEDELGLEVPEDAGRDDIVALVDAASSQS